MHKKDKQDCSFFDNFKGIILLHNFQLQVQAKSGEIGDRTLLVRSAGIYGDPVLEIINRKTYNRGPLEWSLSDEPPIHRITYSRKLTED